jgi:hypothetical protein
MQRNKAMLAWTSHNSVRGGLTVRGGKIKVRAIWIEDPEECIISRDKDEMHVLQMMSSIAENGLVNPNMVILMWLPEDSDAAAQYPLGSVNFDLAQDKPPCPLYAVIGMHTTTAVQRLHERYPDNEDFKFLEVPLIVCARNTVNIQNALYLGTLDNTLQSLHKDMNQWDCVKQMRRTYEYLNNKYENDKQKFKKAWSDYTDSCKESMPYKGGSFLTFTSVCQQKSAVFKLIHSIFSGQVKTNKKIKQNTPNAMTHFQHMGNISTENLTKWLGRVIEGDWNTKLFDDRCLNYKLEIHIKSLVLEHCEIDCEKEFGTWDDLVKEFPKMGTSSFIQEQMSIAPKKRAQQLTAHAKNRIEQMMKECRDDKQRNAMVQVYYCFLCFFLVVMYVLCLLLQSLQTID